MRERSANKNKKDNLFIRIITYALAFGMIINCNSIYGTGIYGSRLNNILLILSFFEVLIIVAIHKVENIDWRKELNSTAMPRIKQYHIINVLKKYIKGIN